MHVFKQGGENSPGLQTGLAMEQEDAQSKELSTSRALGHTAQNPSVSLAEFSSPSRVQRSSHCKGVISFILIAKSFKGHLF